MIESILTAASDLKRPLVEMRQLALTLDGLTVENEKIRAEIVGLGERAIRQINDLAKLSKLASRIYAMDTVAVRGVCDATVRELKKAGIVSAEVDVKYQNKSRLVVANPELLEGVIWHLMQSAIIYNDDDLTAELSVKDEKGTVKVTIRDYGPALPAKVWREIQDGLINRPVAVAMRPGSGGLGLYIATRFSHYMHARIGAVRHRDGASFYINLPVSEQARLF